MPKRRKDKPFPVSIYDSIQGAAHSKHNLSSKNSQHIIPIVGRFHNGAKKWTKTMYINLNDLAANKQEILQIMHDGMNKYHDKANKKVIYSTKNSLGELERVARGCIQLENKKKGLHQDIVDKYYQKDDRLTPAYNKQKIEEMKSEYLLNTKKP